jgi:type I restriction enzyme S subunit
MSLTRYTTYRETGLEWLETIPTHWEVKRLKQFCSVFPSNVDKKSVEGETPVKLCNYTDVYYNDFIAEDLEFMEATATEEQIKKFTLQAGDTIITKDSEAADDIAIAACVTKESSAATTYQLSDPRKLPTGPSSSDSSTPFTPSLYLPYERMA